MNDSKNIVWLASYPKSGNTWFRIFLTNLFSASNKPASINELHRTPIASSRNLFDEVSGLPSSDLLPSEIDRLRPQVYRHIAADARETVFHKVHDAWRILPDGNPLFPPEITQAVIYFIRNPLDVVISFAHHAATSIDDMIKAMNNPNYTFCRKQDRLHNQLQQQLNTWSGHVRSWTRQSHMPVMVLKYEDMLTNSFETFKKAIKFVDVRASDDQIKQALYFSRIEELQRQEEAQGFKEKSPRATSFFRKGSSGDWKNVLSEKQIERLVNEHKTVMKTYGYQPNKYE